MASSGALSSVDGTSSGVVGVMPPPPEPLSEMAAAAAAIAITAAIVPALTPPTAVFAAASPAADPSSAAIEVCGNKAKVNIVKTARYLFINCFIVKLIK